MSVAGRAGAAGDVCESGWRGSQRCAAGQRNFGLWVLRCLQHTFWAEKRDIGKTVGGLLAGIVLVDLLAVQHVAPEVAAVFFGLFILAVLHSAGCRRHKKTGNGFPFPVVIQCVRLRVEGSTFEGEFSHAGLV